jgi:hypothetical protein
MKVPKLAKETWAQARLAVQLIRVLNGLKQLSEIQREVVLNEIKKGVMNNG